MHFRGGVIALLATAGAVQAVILAVRDRPPSGPTVGRPLPDPGSGVVVAGGGAVPWARLVGDGRSCALVVVASPTCAHCQRMRESWRADVASWTDSVGAPVRSLWLMAGDSATTQRFTAGFDLGATTIARLTGDAALAGRRLGIYGTPTVYLLDPTGALRVGVLGNGLPPADSGRAACRAS